MYLYVEPKMAVLLFLWEVNESAQQLTLFWDTCREEGVRLLLAGWGFFSSNFGGWELFSNFTFFSKETLHANIVAHLNSVAVFLCRAKPENPTAVTMPGFLCVDHSIVECWITTMSSGKRSQRLVSLAWLNPPRECLKPRCYMEIISVMFL